MKRFFLLLAAMRLGFFTEGRYSHWSSLPSAASQVSSAVFSTSRGAWKRTRILSRSFGPLSTQRVTRRSLVAPDLLTSRSTCRSSSSRTCCSSRWRFMISRPDCAAAGIAPAARSTIERRATTAPGDVTRPPSEQIAEHGEEAIVVPPAAPESVGLSRQEVEPGAADVQRVVESRDPLEAVVAAVGLHEPGHRLAVNLELPEGRGKVGARHLLARVHGRQPRQGDARRQRDRRAAKHRRVLEAVVVADREIPAG